MAETTPLLPSAGSSRRIRTSAVVAAIGLLLALVLVASLSPSKAPTALESDGEHDSMLIHAPLSGILHVIEAYSFSSVEEHLAKNIYAMSGKSYFPTNPKLVTASI